VDELSMIDASSNTQMNATYTIQAVGSPNVHLLPSTDNISFVEPGIHEESNINDSIVGPVFRAWLHTTGQSRKADPFVLRNHVKTEHRRLQSC
jgi:hypothetical protein